MGKTFLALMLFVLVGLASGCHYGSDDDHRGWGYGRSDTYRDGFRAGRTYERRRSSDWWGYSRYDGRYWR